MYIIKRHFNDVLLLHFMLNSGSRKYLYFGQLCTENNYDNSGRSY